MVKYLQCFTNYYNALNNGKSIKVVLFKIAYDQQI